MSNLHSQIAQLGQSLGAHRVVLFGSRARGDCSERSDIDLAVYGLPDHQLGVFRFSLEELPTLLKFDLVAIDHHTSPELLEEIRQDGVTIYEADED